MSNFSIDKAKEILDKFNKECHKKSYHDLNNSIQCLMLYRDHILKVVAHSELSLEFDDAISKGKDLLVIKIKTRL